MTRPQRAGAPFGHIAPRRFRGAALALVALAGSIGIAACGSYDASDDDDATSTPGAATATRPSGSPTAPRVVVGTPPPASEPTGTPAANPPPVEPTGTGTARPATPSPTGVLESITFSPGEELTAADLAARPYRIDSVPGSFAGGRLVIPKITVDAPLTTGVVGFDGQMPPATMNGVSFYDFSQWPTLGGWPGVGGNVVTAGRFADPGAPEGALRRLVEVAVGDLVYVDLDDGTRLTYRIEFNKVAAADRSDWDRIVASTEDESITLITGAGSPGPGGFSHRRIAWGRRID